MTTIYVTFTTILFFAIVAFFLLVKKFGKLQQENKKLVSKNDELRGYLNTMNTELDSKDEELTELAQDPNSLVGVKYRTQIEIRRNQQLLPLQMDQK